MSATRDDDSFLAELRRITAEGTKLYAEGGRLLAEQQKLVAEQQKLSAGQMKLSSEARKLGRDYLLAPVIAIGGLCVGAMGLVVAFLHR